MTLQRGLASRFEEELRRAGIDAQIVGATVESSSDGDGEVLARLDPMLLRLVRARGQEFVEIGAVSQPDCFHQFDHLEIALALR
jgi:hypothetical protein